VLNKLILFALLAMALGLGVPVPGHVFGVGHLWHGVAPISFLNAKAFLRISHRAEKTKITFIQEGLPWTA